MSLSELNALKLSHRFIRERVSPGDLCVDATAGNGRDTALLAELVGEQGHVTAFDIQEAAIDNTRALLLERGLLPRVTLVQAGHESMGSHVRPGTISCVVFNFGFLPGGDHSIYTRADTSLRALDASLTALRPGGVISAALYYGGPNGYGERDAVLHWAASLPAKDHTALVQHFPNRPSDPPMLLLVEKHG